MTSRLPPWWVFLLVLALPFLIIASTTQAGSLIPGVQQGVLVSSTYTTSQLGAVYSTVTQPINLLPIVVTAQATVLAVVTQVSTSFYGLETVTTVTTVTTLSCGATCITISYTTIGTATVPVGSGGIGNLGKGPSGPGPSGGGGASQESVLGHSTRGEKGFGFSLIVVNGVQALAVVTPNGTVSLIDLKTIVPFLALSIFGVFYLMSNRRRQSIA